MIDAAEAAGEDDRRPGPALRGLHGLDQRPRRLRPAGTIVENADRGDRGHAVDGVRRPATGRPTWSADWPTRPPPRPTCRPRARRRPARCSRATAGPSWSTGPTSTPRPRARSTSGALDQSRGRRHRRGPATRGSTPASRAPRRSAASTWPSATSPTHPDEALAAVKCITSAESNAQYMVESGNPAARAAAYDDPAVREAFPMADLIRDSINDAGAPAHHARTTATSRPRCSAPGTRRRRPVAGRHPRRPTRT